MLRQLIRKERTLRQIIKTNNKKIKINNKENK